MSQWQPEDPSRRRPPSTPEYGDPANVHPHAPPQFQRQPYPQQQQQQQQFPRESVTVTGMSTGALAFHWTMIVCTCGFWYPVYAARRRQANRKAVTRYR